MSSCVDSVIFASLPGAGNAYADLVTIQDLLDHTRIKTTQCYCRVSNLKVQRDYHRTMQEVMKRTARNTTGLSGFFRKRSANLFF